MYPVNSVKPPKGEKLNKPAIVTMFNVKPKGNETNRLLVKRLKSYCYKEKLEHVNYDSASFEWEFKVDEF